MKFELFPHIGTNEIKFGLHRDDVIRILGNPHYSSEADVFQFGDFKLPLPAKDGYYDNELQFTYDDVNKVEFIEFSGRYACHTQVFFTGLEVFKISAPQLVTYIKKNANTEYDANGKEIPYSYIFKEIDLAVWRQVIPELNENINEIPESDEGKYFWTVGIGKKGYYQNI